MVTGLAVPFVGLEGEPGATPVKPDFAIVAPRPTHLDPGGPADLLSGGPVANGRSGGSWLIMGDAKDYERVRSRIDDQRMLKGFLQVALGAESVAAWSLAPEGMAVHRWGALAVPRNAFLQPEAVVECLDDHREEVRTWADERAKLLAGLGCPPTEDGLDSFVAHLDAEFDPATCVSCALFNHCRTELRSSATPDAVLVEIGIERELRPALAAVVAGSGDAVLAPDSVVATVRATRDGRPGWTGQRRVDPVGLPGAIDVVVAKSDGAALGVCGLGVRRTLTDGTRTPWSFATFTDPQAPQTRLAVMDRLGAEIDASLHHDRPVHLVLTDQATADLLVSMADSLAGVETSRLRWQRDLDMGRDALTFDGEPARVPEPLTDHQRLAVSFLLEEDRARAMTLRWPLVDLRVVLARHIVPGGPIVDRGRLDYLVEWAEASGGSSGDGGSPLDHRVVSDTIAALVTTPGARLTNERSDALHRSRRTDPAAYRGLVADELGYKAAIVERATEVLERLAASRLQEVHRALEADAQAVWRRRLELHASDLVRFGRTGWVWRNRQVTMLDDDVTCATQLLALGNPQAAEDLARDAGTRQVAAATVISTSPLRVEVASRRLGDGASIVALHVDGSPCIEAPTTELKVQKGGFKFRHLAVGPLVAEDSDVAADNDRSLRWDCAEPPPELAVGSRLVVADAAWFDRADFRSGHEVLVARPKPDEVSAPKADCHADAYATDPDEHRWCCRSHESSEAEWADTLADRRSRGELNPEVWPPVIDADGFDTPAAGSPTDVSEDASGDGAADRPPAHLTIDDLD